MNTPTLARSATLFLFLFLCALTLCLPPWSLGQGAASKEVAILPGDSTLRLHRIRPHTVTWQNMPAREGSTTVSGVYHRRLRRARYTPSGEKVWRAVWEVDFPERSDLDVHAFRQSDLLPLFQYIAGPRGVRLAHQHDDRITGSVTAPAGGEPTGFDFSTQHPQFVAGMLDIVLATLPLRDRYAVRLPLTGSGGQTRWAHLRVIGKEPVDVSGRTVEAWVVDAELPFGRQRLWISQSPPYAVRRAGITAGGTPRWTWTIAESHEQALGRLEGHQQ